MGAMIGNWITFGGNYGNWDFWEGIMILVFAAFANHQFPRVFPFGTPPFNFPDPQKDCIKFFCAILSYSHVLV